MAPLRALGLVIAVTVALCACAAPAAAAGSSDSCTGTPNTLPLWTEKPEPVAQSTTGRRFVVGPEELSPKLNLIHVYGTPYEWGVARGTLMKDELNEFIPQAFDYMYSQLQPLLSKLPTSWQKAIEKFGIEVVLDLTYDLTREYIAPEFIDECQGMADASGIDVQTIINLSLFPELIKAHCSMFGAWNNATLSSRDGHLVQLRALDWTTNGPFQQYPLVIVYHPTGGNGQAFSVVTWVGLVGAITGYSSSNMGVCEKVWLNYKGKDSRSGIPFTYLLRDILQYDTSVEQAVSRIETANRTCSIFVGVGDAKANTFRGIEYSLQEVNVYDDKDFPAYPPYHDLMEGIVFFDKHTQPSHDPCLNDLLSEYYGRIDAEVTFRNITAVFQTGDMHVAVYDFAEGTMTVANAGVYNATTKYAEPAYNRIFVQLNMTEAFALAAP